MPPQLSNSVCPEILQKALLSQALLVSLARTRRLGAQKLHIVSKEMRRVLLLVATALAFTHNRRRPRGRRRDVLRHAGADDEFVRNAWATCKANLPAIVTGAWDESAGDDEPGGALANLALVRLPLLALLAYYTQYLALDGSPLIVDFGFDDVPQVIPPGVVWTIFGLLLLPIL